jgi:hypothetical protein
MARRTRSTKGVKFPTETLPLVFWNSFSQGSANIKRKTLLLGRTRFASGSLFFAKFSNILSQHLDFTFRPTRFPQFFSHLNRGCNNPFERYSLRQRRRAGAAGKPVDGEIRQCGKGG